VSTDGKQVRGAHLVGSVPLASGEEVFRTAASILGEHLRRIPDGETGVRRGWIGWQRAAFADHPAFERAPEEPGLYGPSHRFRLREPARASELAFGALGYADAAIASYGQFAHLRRAGVVPAHVRFQVSLPTPLAPVTTFVALGDRGLVEPAYQRRLLAELDGMLAAIPTAHLAVQWDVAVEVALLEGVAPVHLLDPWQDIVERLVELGTAVSGDVELGYHLCYGDAAHRHFKEPADLGLLVRLANAVAAGSARPLNWIHLPVPRTRDDDGYFAPLGELHLSPETEVYLGLVHHHDGIEGAERRIAAARRHLARFGVATECGLGRPTRSRGFCGSTPRSLPLTVVRRPNSRSNEHSHAYVQGRASAPAPARC